MEIHRWRYAVTLSQELHFGRAARRHFLAESHFGREIRKLEVEVGEPLFERTSRRVQLTPAGAVLIEEAVSVLESFDRLYSGNRSSMQSAGSIQLGVLGFGLAERWDDYRLGVLAAHPDLLIRFVELDMHEQYRAVLTGRVDVAIVQHLGPVEGLDLITVFRTPRVIVIRSDSRWAKAQYLAEPDLRGTQLLPVADAGFAAWAGGRDIGDDGARMAVRSPAAIPAAVASTGLPCMHAAPAQWYFPHPGVQFRPIEGSTCDVAIATRAHDHRQLVETFRRVARKLSDSATEGHPLRPVREAALQPASTAEKSKGTPVP